MLNFQFRMINIFSFLIFISFFFRIKFCYDLQLELWTSIVIIVFTLYLIFPRFPSRKVCYPSVFYQFCLVFITSSWLLVNWHKIILLLYLPYSLFGIYCYSFKLICHIFWFFFIEQKFWFSRFWMVIILSLNFLALIYSNFDNSRLIF